jgi:hypothetical protein
MIVLRFWLRLIKTIASHTFSWSVSVFESWVLRSSVPIGSALGTSSPTTRFLSLCNRLTGILICKFSFTGVRAP